LPGNAWKRPPPITRVIRSNYGTLHYYDEFIGIMEIRTEQLDDINSVHQVNVAAFGRESEANLVDRLRSSPSTFSFVAVELNQVVGHLFLSPVTIDGNCNPKSLILGLAPVAVMPEHQRSGIGSSLIRHGLAECVRVGAEAIVVLGAPAYYHRFGFRSAIEYDLRCEYDVPAEAFMVLELVPDALKNCAGTVKYRPEFSMVE
jgi:putative acetyltransferase